MAKFKYIIVTSETGLEVPRLGSVLEDHSALKREHEKALRGGFVQITSDETGFDCYCFGESVGCKVKSAGETDSKLIQRAYEFNV